MKNYGRMGLCQTEATCFLEEFSVLHQFDQDMQNTSLQMNSHIRKRKGKNFIQYGYIWIGGINWNGVK